MNEERFQAITGSYKGSNVEFKADYFLNPELRELHACARFKGHKINSKHFVHKVLY